MKMSDNFPVNDEEKKQYLREGKPILFPAPVNGKRESQSKRASRTIKAGWIKDLAEGDQITLPIVISNAIIEDPLNLPFLNFKQEFVIKNSEFLEKVDFSFSDFHRFIELSDSKFNKSAVFRSVQVKYDFNIIGSRFSDDANFEELQVNQIFRAEGARFQDANFERMKVSKSVLFRPSVKEKKITPVEFNGKVKFKNVSIESYSDFRGIKFKDDVDFGNAYFGSTAQFNCFVEGAEAFPCKFGGEANFRSVNFVTNAVFDGAEFEKKADFSAIKAEGYLVFRELIHENTSIVVKFKEIANFFQASVKRNLEFTGTLFNGPANFEGIIVEGSTFFAIPFNIKSTARVEFKSEARFYKAQFKGTTDFKRAVFNSSVNFTGTIFSGDAVFSGAYFAENVDFSSIRAEGYLSFREVGEKENLQYVKFNGDVTFFQANVKKNLVFVGTLFEGRSNFEGVVIEGNVFFAAPQNNPDDIPVEFKSEARFYKARFKGATDFRRAVFNSSVDFTGTVFSNDVFFSGAYFAENANFSSIKVEGYLKFHCFVNNAEPVCSRFDGDAIFFNAHITRNAEFISTQFNKQAVFEGILIEGNTFFVSHSSDDNIPVLFNGEARFVRAHLKANTYFTGVTFNSLANFPFIQIDGTAYFRPAKNGQNILLTQFNAKVDFNNARFGDDTIFQGINYEDEAFFEYTSFGRTVSFLSDFHNDQSYRTTFNKKVSFYKAKFNSNFTLRSVRFRKEVNFNSVQIQGSILFGVNGPGHASDKPVPCRFADSVSFEFAYIKENLGFKATQFEGSAKFNGSQIDGECIFDALYTSDDKYEVINFEDQVSFSGCRFGGNLIFRGVQFQGAAEFRMLSVNENLSFESSSIDDEFYRIVFEGPVDFLHSKIRRRLRFNAALFLDKSFFGRIEVSGDAIFDSYKVGETSYQTQFRDETDFNNSKFNNLLDFRNAVFEKKVNLTRSEVQGVALFNDVIFQEDLTLREAHFSRVNFSNNEQNEELEETGKQFLGKVNLTGFTYNRIEVNWNELLSHVHPYDRQPYTYLEKIFRLSGYDIQADKIYLKRRKRENQILWARLKNKDNNSNAEKPEKSGRFQQLPSLLFDLMEKWLFNYGVRPFRLLFISLVVILFGAFIFSQPNSVMSKDPKLRTGAEMQLDWKGAFNVSLNQFVPIVEIPPGSELKPTDAPVPLAGQLGMSFAGYATIHRLAGFILIPLGIAALTGRLYRREK